MTNSTGPRSRIDSAKRLALICITAIVAGVVTGFVGGAFRWCLERADVLRVDLVVWAEKLPGPGWLVPIAAAGIGALLAALVVQRVPLAAGSGIQHVEAVSRGEARPPRLELLAAKFVGGVLAIGSGLVLGREGPTVHMGAAIGAEAARRVSLPDPEVRTLQTALGGAGLAVAFNAPIGGSIFPLEEVTKSFRLQTILVTLFAAATAVSCSRLVLGDHPDFTVGSVESPSLAWLPLFATFGLLTGCLGALYNRLTLTFVDRVKLPPRVPTVFKATVIGGLMGLVTFIHPLASGGGDPLTQLILGGHGMAPSVIAGFLVLRFLAGPLSYAAAVPGGLFAPLLAVGALWGVLFIAGVNAILAGSAAFLAIPMAIAGMASLFGATVRAPITGIVLVIEMTGTTSVAIPMVAATAAAVLAAEVLRSPPIYDSLRQRMPTEEPANEEPANEEPPPPPV